MRRKRILLIQPSLQPPGGGNGVCSWMLQALRDDYLLAVLSWRPVDLDAINEHFGTSLRPTDLHCFVYPPLLRRFLDGVPGTWTLLKTFLLLKRSRSIQPGFDLVLSVNNEADFGRPGIQYIHYPWNHFPRPSVDRHWYANRATNALYYRLLPALTDYSMSRIKQNVTLVNSDWTGELVKDLYPGIETRTLYPPVLGDFPSVPWKRREDGFVCIGRISREKEIDKIIRILALVRERGCLIHLHIVGPDDDSEYFSSIRTLVRKNAVWVKMNGSPPREELSRLVAAHRYGIHGMQEEHYGMAVAEMVQAGCIVFIPDGGGQVEIVDRYEPLLYRSEEEAAEKIFRVLRSGREQTRLREHLATRQARYSRERFISEFRGIVDPMLAFSPR